jgi:hypothetical protein
MSVQIIALDANISGSNPYEINSTIALIPGAGSPLIYVLHVHHAEHFIFILTYWQYVHFSQCLRIRLIKKENNRRRCICSLLWYVGASCRDFNEASSSIVPGVYRSRRSKFQKPVPE